MEGELCDAGLAELALHQRSDATQKPKANHLVEMNSSLRLIAALFATFFIAACATRVTMIGPARPPISPAAVRIYETSPRHYQQIAIINSSAGTTWLFPDRGSLDEAIAELRTQAAALGANGVRLEAVYDQPVGGL